MKILTIWQDEASQDNGRTLHTNGQNNEKIDRVTIDRVITDRVTTDRVIMDKGIMVKVNMDKGITDRVIIDKVIKVLRFSTIEL